MDLDRQQLARLAPVAIPAAVLLGGWFLLVQPTREDAARAARDVDALRTRLVSVRASISGPAPVLPQEDVLAAFERRVPQRDATAQLLEQLARLAAWAQATNLLIETGDRVVVGGPAGSGPQAASAAPDPRLALFDAPLAYSPVALSFDAEYAQLGSLLWNLREVATTVDINSLEVTRPSGDAGAAEGRVRVSMVLLAYTRRGEPAVVQAGGER
jgi:hypothetical protein